MASNRAGPACFRTACGDTRRSTRAAKSPARQAVLVPCCNLIQASAAIAAARVGGKSVVRPTTARRTARTPSRQSCHDFDTWPPAIADAPPRAKFALEEFFAARIDNAHTKRSYRKAARDFFAFAATLQDGDDLGAITSLHVTAWKQAMKSAGSQLLRSSCGSPRYRDYSGSSSPSAFWSPIRPLPASARATASRPERPPSSTRPTCCGCSPPSTRRH